jgi:uncharacterized damage-inducible protein DinB
MSDTGITFKEFLADSEATTAKWQAWFEAHPQALELLCDVAGSKTVAELVHHIFVVQLRHSQRLLGEPIHGYDNDPVTDPQALFALAKEGDSNLRRFIAQAGDAHANEVIHFTIRNGRQVSVSRRKLFVHIMIHSIRHWAQVSTLLRQNGLHPGWVSDFLGSSAMV